MGRAIVQRNNDDLPIRDTDGEMSHHKRRCDLSQPARMLALQA